MNSYDPNTVNSYNPNNPPPPQTDDDYHDDPPPPLPPPPLPADPLQEEIAELREQLELARSERDSAESERDICRQELSVATQQLEEQRSQLVLIREHLAVMTRNRDQLDLAIQYLVASADGDYERFITCEWGDEDEEATVLVEDPVKRDVFYRTRFSNTGEVARLAALIDEQRKALQAFNVQAAMDELVVEAEVLPSWADPAEIINLGLVGATAGGLISIQQGGPFDPEQAVMVAAWLIVTAEIHLDLRDDVMAGVGALVDKVRNS